MTKCAVGQRRQGVSGNSRQEFIVQRIYRFIVQAKISLQPPAPFIVFWSAKLQEMPRSRTNSATQHVARFRGIEGQSSQFTISVSYRDRLGSYRRPAAGRFVLCRALRAYCLFEPGGASSRCPASPAKK